MRHIFISNFFLYFSKDVKCKIKMSVLHFYIDVYICNNIIHITCFETHIIDHSIIVPVFSLFSHYVVRSFQVCICKKCIHLYHAKYT